MWCHQLPLSYWRIVLALGSLFLVTALASFVSAQETSVRASFTQPANEPIPVNVLTGQSCLVLFDRPIGRLGVSNSDIAEPVLVAPDQMIVNGKAAGRLRLTVWDKPANRFIFLDVDVRINLGQIDAQLRSLFPKEDIRLSQANGSVVLSGSVGSPKAAQLAESIVQAAGFKTVNMISQPVVAATQVQLLIRVAEVSRNKLSEYAFTPAYQLQPGQGGYSNTGQGPWSLGNVESGNMFGSVAQTLNLFVMSNNAFAFLRALQTNGAMRALAEPNLVAMNGQQASFLAGGEFPIPVVQSGGAQSAVSIVYKEYGIRLNFKPTIIDENHIRLELEPEVSTIDYANALKFDGFLIPALRARRAKTGIELQDGQSFGIAGLLDNSEVKSLSKIPVIGDVPILGQLFRSKQFQKQETELVFIVTAKLTTPLNPDAVPRMRGVDGLRDGSPLGVEMPTPGEGKSDAKSDGPDALKSEVGGKDNGEAFKLEREPTAAAQPTKAKPPERKKPARKIKDLKWQIRAPEAIKGVVAQQQSRAGR